MNVLGNLLVAGVVDRRDRSSNRQHGVPQAPYDPRVGYGSAAAT